MNLFRFTNAYRYGLLPLRTVYKFSKSNQNPPPNQKNQNYLKHRMVIKKIEKKTSQVDDGSISLKDPIYLNSLILANLLMVGALPFFPTVNIGITMLNGGFMLSHIGHELKKFLILINNKHYQQLASYKSSHQYLQIILVNSIMLSGIAAFLGYKAYIAAHLLTVLWYLMNFFLKTIPTSSYPLIVAVLMGVIVNFYSNPSNPMKDLIFGKSGQKEQQKDQP